MRFWDFNILPPTYNLPSPERCRCQDGHLRSSVLVPDGFRMLRFRYRRSGGGSHNAWFMVIAIYMFKCAAAQFLFGLFMAWRGRSTRSLHQDLAQLQHGVRTTIVYFYASHPDLPRPRWMGLVFRQMIQTPFNYTLDSVYSARRRKWWRLPKHFTHSSFISLDNTYTLHPHNTQQTNQIFSI